jgi:hypothetical protein
MDVAHVLTVGSPVPIANVSIVEIPLVQDLQVSRPKDVDVERAQRAPRQEKFVSPRDVTASSLDLAVHCLLYATAEGAVMSTVI